MVNCPICSEAIKGKFFESRLAWSVRSDWMPASEGISLYYCGNCHHLFKGLDLVKRWARYDENYSSWDNSPVMDKIDFHSAGRGSRSSKVLEYVRQNCGAKATSRILDFGCNRGNFLSLLPGSEHAGYDVSGHYRRLINELGFDYFTPEAPPPQENYDYLVLIHVFEHLFSFERDLRPGLLALKSGGSVVLQCPDSWKQPFDLYVIDHRSHFSPQSMGLAAGNAGLVASTPVTSIMPGEITGVFQLSTGESKIQAGTGKDNPQILKEFLESHEDWLLQLRKDGRHFMIFGAGLYGSLMSKVLDGQIESFVDDNPGLHGKSLNGIKVKTLDEISPRSSVLVAVPPAYQGTVVERCRSRSQDVFVFSADRQVGIM